MMVSSWPQLVVVDFHHARGPEIEFWVSQDGEALASQNDWSLLPFMALSDGSHTSTEDFSYFTLLHRGTSVGPEPAATTSTEAAATSLFGIACTRQINAANLKVRSADVTRSTVQKAVVVVMGEPGELGRLRERLRAVTNAWFDQGDFANIEILKEFQASLAKSDGDEADYAFRLSLREIIHELKYQTLVLFKCLLLQRKMLFFGSRCERLCMMQFSLISLIPGLLRSLQDCADPALDSYAQTVTKATSLRTSDRSSLLAYMGVPLQIFGKGSFFGPYTPLQQLDILADAHTKSYVVGSTNPLLLQQQEKYSDILINLNENNSISINSPALRTALALSPADRRWIDFLTQTVNDTWDPDNPGRPKNMGYAGSEEFIRLQFEEYLLALLSTSSYRIHQESQFPPSQMASVPPMDAPTSHTETASQQLSASPADPSIDFCPEFLQLWSSTPNYDLFKRLTSDSRIFDIVTPSHPTAGGLSVEDVQRRLAAQVAELHLDERMREGREMVGRGIAQGRERVGRLWEVVEERRRRGLNRSGSQHRSQLDATADGGGDKAKENHAPSLTSTTPTTSANSTPPSTWSSLRDRAAKIQLQKPNVNVDTAQMQASARENAARAGAYLSSWSTWAKERGKEWQESRKSGGAEAGFITDKAGDSTDAGQ